MACDMSLLCTQIVYSGPGVNFLPYIFARTLYSDLLELWAQRIKLKRKLKSIGKSLWHVGEFTVDSYSIY